MSPSQLQHVGTTSLITPTGGSNYCRTRRSLRCAFQSSIISALCHATCSPVSHVAARNAVWQKQLLPTLSHRHGVCYPTCRQGPHQTRGHLLFLTCLPPLAPSHLVSGAWRSGTQPPGAGTDAEGNSPPCLALPSCLPAARTLNQTSPALGRFGDVMGQLEFGSQRDLGSHLGSSTQP